jgi:hypothetical protein
MSHCVGHVSIQCAFAEVGTLAPGSERFSGPFLLEAPGGAHGPDVGPDPVTVSCGIRLAARPGGEVRPWFRLCFSGACAAAHVSGLLFLTPQGLYLTERAILDCEHRGGVPGPELEAMCAWDVLRAGAASFEVRVELYHVRVEPLDPRTAPCQPAPGGAAGQAGLAWYYPAHRVRCAFRQLGTWTLGRLYYSEPTALGAFVSAVAGAAPDPWATAMYCAVYLGVRGGDGVSPRVYPQVYVRYWGPHAAVETGCALFLAGDGTVLTKGPLLNCAVCGELFGSEARRPWRDVLAGGEPFELEVHLFDICVRPAASASVAAGAPVL